MASAFYVLTGSLLGIALALAYAHSPRLPDGAGSKGRFFHVTNHYCAIVSAFDPANFLMRVASPHFRFAKPEKFAARPEIAGVSDGSEPFEE